MPFRVKRIAVVDLESTSSTHSLFRGKGRVVQYGMVVLDVRNMEVLTYRECLVNPSYDDPLVFENADPDSMAIHGIPVLKLVEKGLRPATALEYMFGDQDWSQTCFASWGSFDFEMIRGEYTLSKRHRVPMKWRTLDIRSVCGGKSLSSVEKGTWSYMSSGEYMREYVNVGLELKELDQIRQGLNQHDALYDAATVAMCLIHTTERKW